MIRSAAIRVRQIESRLAAQHGLAVKPRMEPLDELILTILSQNTTDQNRDRAWSCLRETFDSWTSVLNAPREQLESAIRTAGLAHRKARAIENVLRRLAEESGTPTLKRLEDMSDDEALRYLTGFKGVGLKTAACVLCFSLGRPVMPVDTHVHRLCRRLGLVPSEATRDSAHRTLNEVVPPDLRFSLHVHFIRHGRSTCTARQPACPRCVLKEMCPKVGVT